MIARIELLHRIDLFSRLNEQELAVIARNSEFMYCRSGDIVFKEGLLNDSLYILDEGEVTITKRINGSEMVLARFISGECFGEMDLLENKPSSATAIADSDSVLLVFPMKGMQLQNVLANHPDISARILHELLAMIAGRIRSTNKLVSEKAQWIEDLKKQLLTDKLTGTYNRLYIDEDFKSQLSSYGVTTGLIFVKPDDFKKINDTFGHDSGDKALRLMAQNLQSLIRFRDIVARYRGDEFAVVLPETDVNETIVCARRILNEMKKIDMGHLTEGTIQQLTYSIGVAVYPVDADDCNKLIAIAYKKMYEARESGGNRVISLQHEVES